MRPEWFIRGHTRHFANGRSVYVPAKRKAVTFDQYRAWLTERTNRLAEEFYARLRARRAALEAGENPYA